MSTKDKQTHKSTDEPTFNQNLGAASQIATFPATPATHGVTVYAQIEDDNDLYADLRDRQQQLNEAHATAGTSSEPHLVQDDFTPSWDKQARECEVGYFTSAVGYGEQKENTLDRCRDIHLGLYEDVQKSNKSSLPAKTKLVIEKREFGLQTTSGNEFKWPPGTEGERWEGTYLKVQTSYISKPQEAINRAEEMLSAAFEFFDGFGDYGELISNMCRFEGVEAYIRYDKSRAEGTVQELKQSANLVVAGDAEGSECSDVKHGDYTLYGFRSTRFDFLQFDTVNLSVDPKKTYLKTYAANNTEWRSKNSPLKHWKLEAKIRGAYGWEHWNDILHRARRIVCSHAIWAGIREEDLVPDEWFLATRTTRKSLDIAHPDNRRDQLIDFWESEAFERTVIGRMYHSRTESFRDLLLVLLNRANEQITYQEAVDETGLSKRTVRKKVRQLVEDGILRRHRGVITYVRWASRQAKETVKDVLDRGKTESERRREIEKRAEERRERRSNQRRNNE